MTEDVYEDILMTWDDIKRMSQSPYCTIGSHTLSHCRNSGMRDEDILREFTKSKRILEDKIGKPVKYIAYPYGCTTDVRTDIGVLSQQAGYKYGFTVGGIIRRKIKDIYRIPRVLLYNRDI